MILTPGYGIDRLLFGMKQQDVVAVYGAPSRSYTDEDENVVLLYNDRKLRLTFYAEEDLRLGYLITAAKNVSIKEVTAPIGMAAGDAVQELESKGFGRFTPETFDSYENFVNEQNWIILQSEFGEVIKVELGAFIDEKSDEFVWRTK